jgi:Serine hydrolase
MNEPTPIHETDAPPEAVVVPALAVPTRVWRQPVALTLPDWKGAPAAHWLTQWEQQHGLRRVVQHDWLRPLRGDWMMQLQEAVLAHEHCHLLAHGLGGHLVDAWLRHTQQAHRVLSVVLVDPIDLREEQARETLFTWKPLLPQKWAVPVGLLWKERPLNPQLQHWLEACGATSLGDSAQPLGAGAVAGWSLVEAFWRDHDPATGPAIWDQQPAQLASHDTLTSDSAVGTPE